jgi:hypothetical protein
LRYPADWINIFYQSSLSFMGPLKLFSLIQPIRRTTLSVPMADKRINLSRNDDFCCWTTYGRFRSLVFSLDDFPGTGLLDGASAHCSSFGIGWFSDWSGFFLFYVIMYKQLLII